MKRNIHVNFRVTSTPRRSSPFSSSTGLPSPSSVQLPGLSCSSKQTTGLVQCFASFTQFLTALHCWHFETKKTPPARVFLGDAFPLSSAPGLEASGTIAPPEWLGRAPSASRSPGKLHSVLQRKHHHWSFTAPPGGNDIGHIAG